MPEQKPQKGSDEWIQAMLSQIRTQSISEPDLAAFMQHVFENPSDKLANALKDAVSPPFTPSGSELPTDTILPSEDTSQTKE